MARKTGIEDSGAEAELPEPRNRAVGRLPVSGRHRAAAIVEINAWRERTASDDSGRKVSVPFAPPTPTDAPASSEPTTLRSGGARQTAPNSSLGPGRPPLSQAVVDLCRSLPTASLDIRGRARPSSPTSVTQQEMPAALQPPPVSIPWLEEVCPETEAARDTDPGELGEKTNSGPPPSALGRRDRAFLLRLDGAHAGRGFSLGADAVQIGRHPTTDLTLQDRGVSRIHARIYHQHGVHWIEDLGSRNGTYVQGRPIDHCVLEDGDWVQLGPRASFRFAFVDARQEQVLQRLYDSSTRDALTGAYNRSHFDERLQAEVAYALRHGTALSLVMLDIDHFKRVNDRYGHQAGDAVLRHLTGTAQVRLRTEDVFARYGGEEFAVILRGIDLNGAARVGERVRSTLGSSVVFFEGNHIPVSVSAGCASLDCSEERSAAALIRAADRRLYQAKRAGRNRVVASDPPSER